MPGGEDNIECRLEMFKVLLSSGDENCATKFTSHRCVSPKCDVKCVLEIRHESYFIFTICLSRSDFPIKCVRKRERARDVEYVCLCVWKLCMGNTWAMRWILTDGATSALIKTLLLVFPTKWTLPHKNGNILHVNNMQNGLNFESHWRTLDDNIGEAVNAEQTFSAKSKLIKISAFFLHLRRFVGWFLTGRASTFFFFFWFLVYWCDPKFLAALQWML